jgi:hypothetical protein
MSSDPPLSKFAPRNPRSPAQITQAEARAFAFAEEVVGLAVSIVDAAIADINFEGKGDPKGHGLVLLCRSISNFQGALTMARLDQAIESRTLVRSCWENLFLVDRLLQEGAAFVKTMRSHEAWGGISLGETSLKHPAVADTPQGQTVRGLINRERVKFPKPKQIKVSDTAKGDIEKMYPAYAMLSHDAAHPSITALKRHIGPDRDRRLTLDVAPPFKPNERLATLDMACDVLLGACLGVSQLLGGTSQNDALRTLFERFVRQDRRAAATLPKSG